MPKQSITITRKITDLVQQVREIILSARAVAARSLENLPNGLVPFPQIAQIVSAQSIQENSGNIAINYLVSLCFSYEYRQPRRTNVL